MSEFYCPVCGNHYRFPFDKWEAVLEAHTHADSENTKTVYALRTPRKASAPANATARKRKNE